VIIQIKEVRMVILVKEVTVVILVKEVTVVILVKEDLTCQQTYKLLPCNFGN